MKRYRSLAVTAVVLLAFVSATPPARPARAGLEEEVARAPRRQQREPEPQAQELTPPERGVLLLAPNALVRKDAETGQVRIIEGFIKVVGGSKANPTATAQLFIARQRHLLLDHETVAGKLRPVREIMTPAGPHVVFERFLNDLPVFDNEVTVNITKAGDAVNLLLNSQIQIRSADDTVADQSAERARQIAVATVRSQDGVADPVITTRVEKGYLFVDDEGKLVWKVIFDTHTPLAAWEVLVDADTGEVLSKGNVGHYASGRGMVFRPNPIQSTGDSSFTHIMGGCPGCDDARLTDARVSVVPNELDDDTGLLDGTYASTRFSAGPAHPHYLRASSHPDRVYDFTRSDARFREVMAYFWVTESALYIKRELRNLESAIPLRVGLDVHAGDGGDQSMFSSGTNSLKFGTGGVPDAEDAEIILHELGHAIMEKQKKGFGGTTPDTEARAMGEGFGDYWAASFLEQYGPKREWAVFFGKWDAAGARRAHPAQGNDPPYLRRLDSPKRYRDGLRNDEHADGEIWSACLWQIRGILGRQRADTTILTSHFSLRKRPTFSEGADAILDAHRSVYRNAPNFDAEREAIKRVFTDRGIPVPAT